MLAILFLIPVAVIYSVRTELRQTVNRLFFVGGFMGLVAEYWYFQDYWRPPTLLGVARISVEDFLFGVGAVCLGSVIYKFVFRVKYLDSIYPKRYVLLCIYFVLGYSSMIIFNGLLNINSIFVSSIAFLVIAGWMILLRKDLLVPSLLSGLLLSLFALMVYLILFDMLSPNFWDNYWLLSNTKYGIKILGNVPLTELLWYFSWGCLAGIAYDFTFGKGFNKRDTKHI